jgi:hypothetical protein
MDNFDIDLTGPCRPNEGGTADRGEIFRDSPYEFPGTATETDSHACTFGTHGYCYICHVPDRSLGAVPATMRTAVTTKLRSLALSGTSD